MSEDGLKDPIVGIAGAVAGASVGIVALVCIFAKDKAWILGPVVGALALMGIALGALHAKNRQP